MRSRATAGLVACCAAMLLAACTSGGGSAAGTSAAPVSGSRTQAPTPTVTVQSTVTASRTASASPRSSSRATYVPPPPPAPASCADGDLRVTASGGNGASQHDRYVLSFRNISSSTCTLHGYPGLDAVSQDGHVLAHAKRTLQGFMGGSRHGVPTVRVAPSRTASATVEWVTFDNAHPGGNCPYANRFLVTAANTTRAVTIDQQVALCGLQVHPTVPGGTGSST